MAARNRAVGRASGGIGRVGFGQDWPFGADEATSHRILDVYAEAGGNFLDTANKYHNGQTEEYIGRWLKDRRKRMVIATKYSLAMDHTDPNAAGNHRKNLMQAVEGSLRRLGTEAIDLLWVHAYDQDTPIDETQRGLDDLVRMGNVHYIGISDTPAWVISAARVMAELRGWSPVVALQAEYSLLERTPERDMIPMAAHFDMAVTAWAPLAGGVLTGKYTRSGENDSLRKTDNTEKVRTSEKSLAVAQAVDTLAAADVALADEHLRELDRLTQVELGFPHAFLASDHILDMGKSEIRTKIRYRPRNEK